MSNAKLQANIKTSMSSWVKLQVIKASLKPNHKS